MPTSVIQIKRFSNYFNALVQAMAGRSGGLACGGPRRSACHRGRQLRLPEAAGSGFAPWSWSAPADPTAFVVVVAIEHPQRRQRYVGNARAWRFSVPIA